ncbi:MAG: glycosyltransferase family 39 protein [Chloroflexi bacterium]|nr:glycosyltransferase family 39 protein [Chloroflexota bacterium]
MVLLVALLLAFLAQNLLTPYAPDFAGVCGVLLVLALCMPRARAPVRNTGGWLAALVVLLVALWQFVPRPVAAMVLFAVATVLFVRETRTSAPELAAPPAPVRYRTLEAVAVALIIAVSAVLCIYDNAHIQPGLHGDEAESGIEARHLNEGRYGDLIGVGWYDQPLASFVIQAAGLRLFGDNVSGLRTTSAVVSLLTLPLVYLLARRMFGRRVALLALLLMATAAWFIGYARIGINYNQTTFLQVIAVLSFWEGWQRRSWLWYLMSGIAVGLGLYLYFASRLVPILLGAWAAFRWSATRIRGLRSSPDGAIAPPAIRHLVVWAAALLIIFAPMGEFFYQHAAEFNSRAAFVFLFSDSQWNTREEKLQTYTGTTDVPSALAVQVQRYVALFNFGGARDGQYGNTLSLLDYYTAVMFVLGLGLAIYRARDPRFMLLLMWLVLTVFVGGVLTIEAPFTPRLVGLMPVPFMLAAVALDRLIAHLQPRFAQPVQPTPLLPARLQAGLARLTPFMPAAAVVLLLTGSIYFNYWSYFERYIHSIDGWAQREPATVVANYAVAMGPSETLYVLSAPELYVWHGTIRFLAPSLRGFDLLNPDYDLPIRDPATQNASFVMLPGHLQWLENLKLYYPHGVVREYTRPWGEAWFTIYEVPAEDIAAKR